MKIQNVSQAGYISTHTVIFAQSLIRSLSDMAGQSFKLKRSSFKEAPFLPVFNMIIYTHFTGTVQGDYVIAMDEETAAKIAGIYSGDMPASEIRQRREEYSDFVKEVLNLAVAQALLPLEQTFGKLTYMPATVVYGEVKFPEVSAGHVRIESSEADIQCGLCLNLARLKITAQLAETLQQLEDRKTEADETRKCLENILQKFPTCVFAINMEGRILPGYSCTEVPLLVGYEPEGEIEGMELTRLLGFAPDVSEEVTNWISLVFLIYSHMSFSFEKLLLICKDEYTTERQKILRLDWLPVADPKTLTLQKLIAVIEDVTEKRRLEEEIKEKEKLKQKLRQVQKMEAVGTMAGGIAHDFNNILMVIIGYTEMCLSDLPAENKIRRKLERIFQASNRAADLVRQMLTFSRQTDQKRKPVFIEPVIKEAMKLIRASLPSTIEIRRSVPDASAKVLADVTQMHQVMMNLCINAGHAMEEKGGVLTVSLEDFVLDDGILAKRMEVKPGDYVKLTVSDTGHGMDREILERIFDPFFTTKEQGKGTGLGMSVVYGIIKAHEGAIKVYSEPGKGTSFQIFLPKTLDSAAKENHHAPAEPIPGGTECILFIDDEEFVADIAREALSALGYKVVVRTEALRGLDTFRVRPDLFDLVITDQTMPHMTGTDLARAFIRIRPDIPVILCSGFNYPELSEKANRAGIREMLIKPFSRHKIAQVIRKVLDRNGS